MTTSDDCWCSESVGFDSSPSVTHTLTQLTCWILFVSMVTWGQSLDAQVIRSTAAPDVPAGRAAGVQRRLLPCSQTCVCCTAGPVHVTPVPRVPAARVASHSRVFCVWRGGKGGHGGVCRREVQPLPDGVHHLQRDHPPQLSEGDHARPLVLTCLFSSPCPHVPSVSSSSSDGEG